LNGRHTAREVLLCLPQALIHLLGALVQLSPLDLAILDIYHASSVEHVAARVKLLTVLLALLAIGPLDQCGVHQNHIPSLVHEWGAAVCARNLAGQLVPGRLATRIVPDEVMVTMSEVQIRLVENGSPLEGCA
jgi:hypothetical protein